MTAVGGKPGVRVVGLVLVGLWSVYQCLWGLERQNLTGDEWTYVTAGWQYVHGDLHANLQHPPTAKYLYGLAQLVAGEGSYGPRVLAGLAVLAGGAVLFVWLRATVGWWTGLLAAGLWCITRRGGAGQRVDRLALLEPMMTLFALGALAAAWVWVRTDRHRWLVVSGVLLALSVTSKVSTLVLVPAVAALPLLWRRPRRTVVLGALAWIAAFTAVAVALYVPAGGLRAVRFMLAYQTHHDDVGHAIVIRGHVYAFAPWWANGWFMLQGLGGVTLAVILLGVVLALARPDRLVVFLASAVLLLVVFYVGVSDVALPSYYYAWMPFLTALAAVGYGRLASWGPRRLATAVVAAAVVASGIASSGLSRTIAYGRLGGLALVPDVLAHHGVGPGARILFNGCAARCYNPYFSGTGTASLKAGPFAAIVLGRDPRNPVAEPVRAVLATHPREFDRYVVDDVVVWIPRGRLVYAGGVLTVR